MYSECIFILKSMTFNFCEENFFFGNPEGPNSKYQHGNPELPTTCPLAAHKFEICVNLEHIIHNLHG